MKKTSISDMLPYVDFCKSVMNDETGELLKTFRTNPDYDLVVPGSRPGEQVEPFVPIIRDRYPEILEHLGVFVKNQGVFGGPVTHEFDIGTFDVPMVLHIYYLAIARAAFGPLDGMRICEIGPGAGLFFKVLTDISKDVKYTFVDLEAPLYIVRKYVEYLGREDMVDGYLPCHTVLSDGFECEEFDLVTSDCAFNELDGDVQDVYIEKIFNKSKRGRIACYSADWQKGEVVPKKTADIYDAITHKDKVIIYDGFEDVSPDHKNVPTIYWGRQE